MNHVEQYLSAKLEERIQAGNLRSLPPHRHGIDFCSNDYLGFATNGITTPHEAATPNAGAKGSRLLSGNYPATEQLEATIAAFHKADAARIFNSGYDANVGLLSSIASRDTIYIYDILCHASIIDGIRSSLCKHKYKFAHNNVNELETLLQKHSNNNTPVIVVVEAVYSMDGDTAPLQDIAPLCQKYGAQLVVDEAHATGVIGTHGEGLVCSLGLQGAVFARVHTFGKALGAHGAAVLGSPLLIKYLTNFARSLIYTTTLPPATIHAIQSAYNHLSDTHFTTKPLHDIIAYFRERIAAAHITGFKDSHTPIQVLLTGGNDNTRQLAAKLHAAGLLVHPILHPTVPLGEERLRICLHTFNTKDQIDLLIQTLHP